MVCYFHPPEIGHAIHSPRLDILLFFNGALFVEGESAAGVLRLRGHDGALHLAAQGSEMSQIPLGFTSLSPRCPSRVPPPEERPMLLECRFQDRCLVGSMLPG